MLVGKLDILIGTKTAGLQKGFKKGERLTADFSAGIARLGRRLAGLGALLAGGGIGIAISRQFESIDKLGKTASKLGIGTRELGRLRFAAERTGVEVRTLDVALQGMTRRTSEAAAGVGEAKAAIKELGLDPQQLAGLSPEKQFAEIAEAMGKVARQSDKVRLSQKLFDSEGVALVNTLALGKQGLKDMGDQADALGLTLDDAAVKRVMAAKDAFDNFKASAGTAFTELAIGVTPMVTVLSETLTGLILVLRNMDDQTRTNVFRTVALVAAFAAGIAISVGVIKAVMAISAAYKVLTKAQIIQKAFSGPAGWAVIAAGAAVAAAGVAALNEVWEAGNKALDEALAKAKEAGEVKTQLSKDRIKQLQDEMKAQQEVAKLEQKRASILEAAGRQSDIVSFGLDDPEELAVFDLQAAGGTAAQVEQLRNLFAHIKSMQEFNKETEDAKDAVKDLRKEGATVFSAMRTDAEKFNDRMADLNRLVNAGAIDWNTYARAVAQAKQEIKGTERALPAVMAGTAAFFELMDRDRGLNAPARLGGGAGDNGIIAKLDEVKMAVGAVAAAVTKKPQPKVAKF